MRKTGSERGLFYCPNLGEVAESGHFTKGRVFKRGEWAYQPPNGEKGSGLAVVNGEENWNHDEYKAIQITRDDRRGNGPGGAERQWR